MKIFELNEGDVVLDIFSGTFTTSFVAKQLKRKSIGIELQEKYVEIGLNRLEIICDDNKFYFKLSATDIACNKDSSSLLQTQLNTEN
ncbi:MAG: DNA methyltransferase [Microcoleus sp.]